MLYPCLVHGEDVGVALDEVALIGLGDRTLSPVEAVELAALGVDDTLGGVDVLGRLGLATHDASPEGYVAST